MTERLSQLYYQNRCKELSQNPLAPCSPKGQYCKESGFAMSLIIIVIITEQNREKAGEAGKTAQAYRSHPGPFGPGSFFFGLMIADSSPLLSPRKPEYYHRVGTRNTLFFSSSSPYLYNEVSGTRSAPATPRQPPIPSSVAPATTIQHQAWVGSLLNYCDAFREAYRKYSSR